MKLREAVEIIKYLNTNCKTGKFKLVGKHDFNGFYYVLLFKRHDTLCYCPIKILPYNMSPSDFNDFINIACFM